MRFSTCLVEAAGGQSQPVAAASLLATRAFGGDSEAWAPLVAAVRRLLAGSAAASGRELKARRELRAFVAENADLLEA